MPNIRNIPFLLITLATGYQARVTAQDSDAGQTGEPAVAPVVLDGDTPASRSRRRRLRSAPS